MYMLKKNESISCLDKINSWKRDNFMQENPKQKPITEGADSFFLGKSSYNSVTFQTDRKLCIPSISIVGVEQSRFSLHKTWPWNFLKTTNEVLRLAFVKHSLPLAQSWLMHKTELRIYSIPSTYDFW